MIHPHTLLTTEILTLLKSSSSLTPYFCIKIRSIELFLYSLCTKYFFFFFLRREKGIDGSSSRSFLKKKLVLNFWASRVFKVQDTFLGGGETDKLNVNEEDFLDVVDFFGLLGQSID